jgi:CheY-like chemotaxis protein
VSGMTSAALVAAIREALGETQEGLARRLGVSFPTVNAWERGRSEPRARHRTALEELATEAGVRHATMVMVIDDDVSSIEIIQALVSEFDDRIVVAAATNGAEGLLRCGSLRPDVLFLDIMMPGLDGLEVARRLREIQDLENVQIVFTTSSREEAILERARELGRAVLAKPLDPSDIEAALSLVFA